MMASDSQSCNAQEQVDKGRDQRLRMSVTLANSPPHITSIKEYNQSLLVAERASGS
jgi:hypothetical protein